MDKLREVTREVRLQQWCALLREQQDSGQSIRFWCMENGVVEKTFHYWKRRLREAAYEQLTEYQATAGKSDVAFSEVRLITAPSEEAEAGTTGPSQLHLEIGGVRFRADSGYPADKLAELLRQFMQPC